MEVNDISNISISNRALCHRGASLAKRLAGGERLAHKIADKIKHRWAYDEAGAYPFRLKVCC
ncbi:uncharacterized protein Asalp_15340 [Aeromonas salmonicida subsp. pectinolytica 34mel]|uniref:Uncharacterized protein n=1 Tax=Aeromonas salmonicida subsp. pectinolytica 34mel TaxID=1324960 RepID=A0A2D1QEC0_AERSA|nr:uncharacterized protein Asalp_15340 [Aeromonas salmonicida subsp. pectinolytica 34mel]KTA80828.1 hypothetical protein VO69_13265 [Aeromonas salmonicida]